MLEDEPVPFVPDSLAYIQHLFDDPLALSLTQLSKLGLWMPNTLAVTDMVCPPLTNLRASILNSSVYLAHFLVSLIAFTLNSF